MSYAYSGEAHVALRDSYDADEAPFPTSTSLQFPRRDHLRDEAGLLSRLLFPRCWNGASLVGEPDHIRDCLDELGSLVRLGVAPYLDDERRHEIDRIVERVLDELPALRERVKKDVVAAYKGDPAAKSYLEIVRSYPGVHALWLQRFAHELYELDVPEYARELTEYAKSETGIDIHPGAELGDYLFIDHGTGVVIGETATVGEWTRIYQNVTLGALHFEEDEDEEHALKKGYKRHPDIGDHVVIGAGSNILGPVTIGDHVSIGANSWITDDVPDHTSVFIAEHPKQVRKQND